MATPIESSDKVTRLEVEAGTVLFRQDDVATHVYILDSATVKLTRRAFVHEFVVEELGGGAVLGEMAFVSGGRHLSTASVATGGTLFRIDRDHLEVVTTETPKVVERLFAKLAARLAYTNFRLSTFALRSIEARLMLQLRYEVFRVSPSARSGYVPIPFDLPQVLGIERGALVTNMEALIRESLIETDGTGGFQIPDIEAFDRKLSYLELRDRFE
jgi:CRP-like cAMP-binding protein